MPGKRPEPPVEFVQLLTSNQSRLYAYVLSLMGDCNQAKDVMQETNAVLWRKANDFELGSNFGAWMLKVAYFQVMAHRQRLTRDRLVFDDEFLHDETFRFGLVGDHGHLGLTLANGEQSLQIVDSSPLPLEEWTHVAVVKTNEALRLYQNGVLVSSELSNGFQVKPHSPFSIGGIPKKFDIKKRHQRSGFWHGRIDELAFFGSALTSQQIEHLFKITPSN